VTAGYVRYLPVGLLLGGGVLLAFFSVTGLLLMPASVRPGQSVPTPIQITIGDLLEKSWVSRCPQCPAWGSLSTPTLPGEPPDDSVHRWMAHIAFRDPEPMRVGITKDIEVRISAGDALPAGLTADLAGDGPIRTYSFPLPPLRLHPLIIVHLGSDPAAF
jgi:hypothetical protein